ncbi:musculin [Crotalus adamanteus]|uniref:Musculin n=1 Tax=Crotalus adamanteus TaxID=8729 RepID=A0AAW1B4H9_CROAD
MPPDNKLSKLDMLRLASSYIAHLRQLLQEDCYEKGYVHPVNLRASFGGTLACWTSSVSPIGVLTLRFVTTVCSLFGGSF